MHTFVASGELPHYSGGLWRSGPLNWWSMEKSPFTALVHGKASLDIRSVKKCLTTFVVSKEMPLRLVVNENLLIFVIGKVSFYIGVLCKSTRFHLWSRKYHLPTMVDCGTFPPLHFLQEECLLTLFVSGKVLPYIGGQWCFSTFHWWIL